MAAVERFAFQSGPSARRIRLGRAARSGAHMQRSQSTTMIPGRKKPAQQKFILPPDRADAERKQRLEDIDTSKFRSPLLTLEARLMTAVAGSEAPPTLPRAAACFDALRGLVSSVAKPFQPLLQVLSRELWAAVRGRASNPRPFSLCFPPPDDGTI